VNTNDLDEMIGSLDPVTANVSLDIDAHRDDAWRSIAASIATSRTRRRYPRLVVASSVVTLCAAITLMIGLLPGATPLSAAATTLARAAQRDAGSANLPPLATGQYYYQSSFVSQTCGFAGLATSSNPSPQWIDFVTTGTRETWTASAGSGDVRLSPNPTGVDGSGFATPQDQATWIAEGEPNNFCDQADPVTSTTQRGGSVTGYDGFGYILSVAANTQLTAGTSVNNLPTDPSTLAQMLADGEINIDGSVAPSPQACPSGSSSSTSSTGCSVEEQAELITRLLQLPDASAKLGSALYEVLSQLPGSELVGPATNAYGQMGTEITEPLGEYELLKVVVNTTSGALLETEVTSTPAYSAQPYTAPLDVKASYGTIEVVNGSGVRPGAQLTP
jgi:hypothetical protein